MAEFDTTYIYGDLYVNSRKVFAIDPDEDHKHVPDQVGLGNVNNWTASDSVSSTSKTVYATSYAVKTAYDKGVTALNTANTKLDKVGGVIENGTSATTLTIRAVDANIARLNVLGYEQGTGMLYVGQSLTHGGGIIYNGDHTPAVVGEQDYVSFYRTNAGVDTEVFKYKYSNNLVIFNGDIRTAGDVYINGGELWGDGKQAFRFSDEWLRLNPASEFTAGIYAGSTILRIDGSLQVGSNGTTFLASASALTYKGKKIWHEDNDGSGSGLDADTLDGLHESNFLRSDNNDGFTGVLNSITKYGGIKFTHVTGSEIPTYWTSGSGISSGVDGYGLTKANNINIQTWYGFSVSSTIGNYAVPQGSPAFSVNARSGEAWLFSKMYVDKTQRVFADNYHPNADKLTTPRTITLAGDLSGNTTFDGSANVTITGTVLSNSHTHAKTEVGLGSVNNWGASSSTTSTSATTYATSSAVKTTMDRANAAYDRAVPLERTLGLTVDHSYNWINASPMVGKTLVGSYHPTGGNCYISLGSADGILDLFVDGQIYVAGGDKKVFHDTYHPNADVLTTARTITLNGDVSGSTTFNGSANVTIAAVVADNSHNHTTLTGVESIRFNAQSSDYVSIATTISGSNTYLDFNLSDDYYDTFRWRYNYWNLEGGHRTVMQLVPRSDDGTKSDLTVTGFVTSEAFKGNADTTTKLQTARTIALVGEVSGSATFDGSGDISIDVVIPDGEGAGHNHDTTYYTKALSDSRYANREAWSLTPTETGWHTIAVISGGNRATARFKLMDEISGRHGYVEFIAGVSYGKEAYINVIGNCAYGNGIIGSTRITQSASDEVYGTVRLQVNVIFIGKFTIVKFDDEVPHGAWTSQRTIETGLMDGDKVACALTITDRLGFITTGEFYSGNNRGFHDDYHPNADKLTTARTITLAGDLTGNVSFDGSQNVTLSGQVVNDSHQHTKIEHTDYRNSIDLIDRGNHTWLRNTAGYWTFQSGTVADDWLNTITLTVPDVATVGLNDTWARLGQVSSNSSGDGSYRGLHICRVTANAVVNGDLKVGNIYHGTGEGLRWGSGDATTSVTSVAGELYLSSDNRIRLIETDGNAEIGTIYANDKSLYMGNTVGAQRLSLTDGTLPNDPTTTINASIEFNATNGCLEFIFT